MPTTQKSKEGVFAQRSRRKRESGPRVARALIILIVSGLFFGGVWAATTEIGEIARAEGEFAPAGELRRVDHFDGGEIAEILVAVGSEVESGQPLARVEHPNIAAQIAEIDAELRAAVADISDRKWLLGETLRHQPSFSAKAKRESFAAQQHILQQRIGHLRGAAEVAARLRENTKRRIGLSEQSLARFESLRDRGVASEAAYIAQAEETASVQSDYLESEASHAKALSALDEAAAARDEARLVFRQEHLDALFELEKKRQVLEIKLADLRQTQDRQVVRAPEAGTIQSISVTTIGEVVPPGALLFEVLPVNERLVAIVKVNTKDIGFVEEGSFVVLKPAGLDPKRHGEVTGGISVISPTSIAPEREDPYFRAVVELDHQSTGEGAMKKELRAGMTLQAEIHTQKRTIADYLLKPVRGFFTEALSER